MTVEDERLAALAVSARRKELAAMVRRGRPDGGDVDDRTISRAALAAAARVAARSMKPTEPPYRA